MLILICRIIFSERRCLTLNIIRIRTGELKSNCYIIPTNKNNCLIFDPGDEFDKINNKIIKNNLSPTNILLTHGHYDHIGAVADFKKFYPNIKVAISKEDEQCLTNNSKNLSSTYSSKVLESVSSDLTLNDGSNLQIDDVSIFTISTPGHTRGSVCYFINNEILLTGDTLFKNSVGRTDFEGGSQTELKQSIKKLYTLLNPSNLKQIPIYPGHWLTSNLQSEYENNPYLQFLKDY